MYCTRIHYIYRIDIHIYVNFLTAVFLLVVVVLGFNQRKSNKPWEQLAGLRESWSADIPI